MTADAVTADALTADAAPPSALVLFSGGQDSTVCLAWALERHARVETIGFDYGQRHAAELAQRPIIRERLAALHPAWKIRLGPDHLLDLRGSMAALGGTALTGEAEIAPRRDGLPTTFVPGRNLLFLVYAAALAARRDLALLVGGMCETDFSGYPDCRRATLDAQERAIALGLDRVLPIATPLMDLDKAATWALGWELGGEGLERLVVEDTHTCYQGARDTLHGWGYGCGECPACHLRRRGWEIWRARRRLQAWPPPTTASSP